MYIKFYFRYMEGKVFVALGNGDLVVYCRDIGKSKCIFVSKNFTREA